MNRKRKIEAHVNDANGSRWRANGAGGKLAFFLALVLLIGAYLLFRPRKSELPLQFPFLADTKIESTEWRTTDGSHALLRFTTDRRLDTSESFQLAKFARSRKSDSQLTVLFEVDGIKADYAAIEYPGEVLTEPNAFDRKVP